MCPKIAYLCAAGNGAQAQRAARGALSASSSRSGVSGISAGRGSSAATSASLLQLSAGLAWRRSAIFFKISQIAWNCFQNLEWLGQNTQPPCRAIISNCNSARGSTRTSRSTRTTNTRTSELPLRTLNNSLSEKKFIRLKESGRDVRALREK